MFLVGFVSIAVYFVVFRFLILKFDFKTPGRQEGEIQLYSKADYKSKSASGQYKEQANGFIEAFGGKENIDTIANCATRLRISVKDQTVVREDSEFIKYGAHGVVRNGNAFQIIVGLSVSQVREAFDELMEGEQQVSIIHKNSLDNLMKDER
ncbi:glucose PTS transporter subunit EIIB [Vagococcus acidifermentans]